MTPSPTAFASTLDCLLEVVMLMESDMQTQLTARGLTKARTHVLWELSRRSDAHQRELADAVGVTPRTMTGLIDGLESTGFVVRRPDPRDRRAIHIELTEKGRQAAEWLVAGHKDLARSLFGELSATRYACFAAGLTEVRDRLRAAIETAAMETAATKPAPTQTAPIQTAPIQTAPIQTMPIQTASVRGGTA